MKKTKYRVGVTKSNADDTFYFYVQGDNWFSDAIELITKIQMHSDEYLNYEIILWS